MDARRLDRSLRTSFTTNGYKEPLAGPQEIEYVVTELEPTFDAADFIRFGMDIFVHTKPRNE